MGACNVMPIWLLSDYVSTNFVWLNRMKAKKNPDVLKGKQTKILEYIVQKISEKNLIGLIPIN